MRASSSAFVMTCSFLRVGEPRLAALPRSGLARHPAGYGGRASDGALSGAFPVRPRRHGTGGSQSDNGRRTWSSPENYLQVTRIFTVVNLTVRCNDRSVPRCGVVTARAPLLFGQEVDRLSHDNGEGGALCHRGAERVLQWSHWTLTPGTGPARWCWPGEPP